MINYILDERYYNCLNEYDDRYEEEFEILYEIDEDILEEIAHSKSKVIEKTYPIHKLEDYIEAFEMIDGEDSWIDLETCEVYDDYYFEENDMDDEEIEEFYNNPNVISLPGRNELNEYEDMVSFVDSLDDNYIKERLYQALKGKGAFKRFKNEIVKLNVRGKYLETCFLILVSVPVYDNDPSSLTTTGLTKLRTLNAKNTIPNANVTPDKNSGMPDLGAAEALIPISTLY